MKGLVKRCSSGYHVQRLEELKNVDVIASTLLALNWSRRHCDTFKSQSLIQLDCVACCYVQNSLNQIELWVASNSQTISDADLDALIVDIGDNIPIFIVHNGQPYYMHAEMQLLVEINNSQYTTNYIGVSKPCCEMCKKELDNKNISYTHWHQSNVKKWQNPNSEGAYIK